MKTPFGDGTCLVANFMRKLAASLSFLGDMMQLDPSKLALELAHLLAVRRHERAFARGFLHDLINDQFRVSTNVEPHSTELNGDA